jgi:hypothetical protein
MPLLVHVHFLVLFFLFNVFFSFVIWHLLRFLVVDPWLSLGSNMFAPLFLVTFHDLFVLQIGIALLLFCVGVRKLEVFSNSIQFQDASIHI